MLRAEYKDKELIVDILSKSFDDNKGVNYTVKQDSRRKARVKKLMAYSFEICYRWGDVFLSDDRKGCALVTLPDKKKTTIKSILLDVQLVLSVIGLANVNKVMRREKKINELHPGSRFYYLWFIGVYPAEQNRGIGAHLMKAILNQAELKQRPVYLETSTVKNIPWYQKFGFTVYDKLDFGYELFCMKRE